MNMIRTEISHLVLITSTYLLVYFAFVFSSHALHLPFFFQMAIKSSTITSGLKYSLATGNWGMAKATTAPKAGVSQVLNRLTFASTLSHLRRMNTPLAREGKMAKPRQLHNTHWGMVCPAETPEGQAVGLVKNLSLMAYISVGWSPAPIIEFLEEWTTENLDEVRANQSLLIVFSVEKRSRVILSEHKGWFYCAKLTNEMMKVSKSMNNGT